MAGMRMLSNKTDIVNDNIKDASAKRKMSMSTDIVNKNVGSNGSEFMERTGAPITNNGRKMDAMLGNADVGPRGN